MERAASPRAERSDSRGGLTPWLWSLALLALVAWHGWKTLHLFDDQPVLSGKHPLHLYHGYLGSRAFRATHRLMCYDPAFQSGYPKTPVFDSGSRPAELCLTVAGGYDPAAYKIGLAVACVL